jgi:hypothetical protein
VTLIIQRKQRLAPAQSLRRGNEHGQDGQADQRHDRQRRIFATEHVDPTEFAPMERTTSRPESFSRFGSSAVESAPPAPRWAMHRVRKLLVLTELARSQPPSAPIGLTVKTFAADLIRHDLRDIFRCGGAGVPDETLLSSSLSALVHMTESKNKKGT